MNRPVGCSRLENYAAADRVFQAARGFPYLGNLLRVLPVKESDTSAAIRSGITCFEGPLPVADRIAA